MRPKVLIVDAYSSGNQYAPAFAEHGYSAWHIQSRLRVPKVYAASFRSKDFDKSFIFDGDFDALVSQLRDAEIKVCVPGCEIGVELASRLCEALNLPGNSSRLAEARRDKFLMGEQFLASQVRTPKHLWVTERHQLDDVGPFPLIVKPRRSAGTDDVRLCKTKDELKSAFDSIVGKLNALNERNDGILIQEYIDGEEFAVNTLSVKGKHSLLQIWHYKKLNGFVYESEVLVAPETQLAHELFHFVSKALNALEITDGPSHTEVKKSSSGELVVIECAARLDGLSYPEFENECLGISQMDLIVESFLHKRSRNLNLKKHARNFWLISSSRGYINSLLPLQEIQKLPSFFDWRLRIQEGGVLQKTHDLFSSPGIIFLSHEDPQQIEVDQQRIRDMEQQGLFERCLH